MAARSDPETELGAVTAAVLAGGLGTRLRSVVADRPKALASVAGRPFLAYLLDRLAEAGVRRAVLCTGYLGDQVQAALGERHHGMALDYSREPEPLGTGGGLRLALPLLATEWVVALNGDSFCTVDLPRFFRWHRRRGACASLLLARVEDTARYGRVRLARDGAVRSFQEKDGPSGPGWISAGVYVLSRDLVSEIPAGRPVSMERDVFPSWIGRGLYGFRGGSSLLDIGTPESYARSASRLAS